MSQRNFMNERYQDENRTGKSRKSAASAKPKAARAATVRDPAPKTKKQLKEERRERERKAAEKAEALQTARFEDTDTYKSLRRVWWVALIGAIVCTAASFYINGRAGELPFDTQAVSMGVMVLAYVLIIVAFAIDLGKIRKERKLFNAALATNKSKAARKEQKRLRAEHREQEKEAAEKFEAAKAEEEAKAEKRRNSFLGFFNRKKSEPETAQSALSETDRSEADQSSK